MKLILASTSKLKNEILDKVRMKHESINSDFEEKSSNKNNVYKYVKDLSFGKAKSVEEKSWTSNYTRNRYHCLCK